MLASGTGSLFRALLDASSAPEHPVHIVALGVDRECAATEHADAAGVTTFRVSLRDFATREQWDAALADAVAAHTPDLIVTAGFMKILGPRFLELFAGKIVNSHPALLPSFPGAHAVRDALAYGVKVTGTTVHLVDDGIDSGPILAQEAVVVRSDDDEETLHERIKVVERRLLADVVTAVAVHGVVSDGRKAGIASE